MPTDLDAPEVRARIIEERWRMAVMDGHPNRFEMDGSTAIDPYMTKPWHRIAKSFQEIVGVVSENGVGAYEFQDGDPDSLDELIQRIWEFAEAEIVAWASQERRRARWEAWRAREAAPKVTVPA